MRINKISPQRDLKRSAFRSSDSPQCLFCFPGASQEPEKCYSALLRTCSLLRDDNGAVVEPDVRRDGRALCASGAALRQRQNVGGLRILAEHVPALEPRTNSI